MNFGYKKTKTVGWLAISS